MESAWKQNKILNSIQFFRLQFSKFKFYQRQLCFSLNHYYHCQHITSVFSMHSWVGWVFSRTMFRYYCGSLSFFFCSSAIWYYLSPLLSMPFFICILLPCGSFSIYLPNFHPPYIHNIRYSYNLISNTLHMLLLVLCFSPDSCVLSSMYTNIRYWAHHTHNFFPTFRQPLYIMPTFHYHIELHFIDNLQTILSSLRDN